MIFTLDIGGTYTKYAHIEKDKIISKGKWETTNDFSVLVSNIDRVICSPVDYIGISSGGFWDREGMSIGYETLESTSKNNLTKFLSKKYRCPVYIENDARCALLAEKKYGALKDKQNAVLFVLGSSLGCAVMIDGKLFSGSTNQAGAMFMMPEYYNGSDYLYDKKANSIELTKEYDSSLKKGNMIMLEERALQNDEKAESLIESYSKAVALKCWYAYLLYDPELIALGGAISNSEYIVEKIKHHLDCFFANDKSTRKPKVINTHFGSDSNLLGAAVLGID
ncbi:ROK family protein [Eubacterium sp.]|uniref:ROK family protein n=1 Tax=Eubacterium sp. TaxID=142586 RepID=UPI003F00ECC0